ncbi:hypothetical protein [Rubrobacter aplysinae]|uniref:hypothetical protein n=1 Tax=Rubrobacter aplysinae TaxID=909625 RepID=UPI00128BD81F|nr:hypothetical protein [Rubrobacter aplysinae]
MDYQAFAFGCFHFGLRGPTPNNFTVSDFLEEVEKALRAVPNVDNVRASCDDEFLKEKLGSLDSPPSIKSGSFPYPHLPHGDISFDLLVPKGVQREFARSYLPLTFTERFRVEIFYEYHFPVATIELISPTEEPEPSEAVIIIRRLLEREFERQQGLIDFQFTGPSPIHADFYLIGRDSEQEDTWDFDLEVERSRAYDRYEIFFNESLFSEPNEALSELKFSILSELDLFYLIAQLERQKGISWEQVNQLTRSLTALHQRKGARAFVARLLKSTNIVNEAFVTLAEFESNDILSYSMLQDSYSQVYTADAYPYIKNLVDKRMNAREKYPTKQVSSLLQIFETRRLTALEIRVALISAVSGGAVGALVSTIVSNP